MPSYRQRSGRPIQPAALLAAAAAAVLAAAVVARVAGHDAGLPRAFLIERRASAEAATLRLDSTQEDAAIRFLVARDTIRLAVAEDVDACELLRLYGLENHADARRAVTRLSGHTDPCLARLVPGSVLVFAASNRELPPE